MTETALKSLAKRIPFQTVAVTLTADGSWWDSECADLGITRSELGDDAPQVMYTARIQTSVGTVTTSRPELWTLFRDYPDLAQKAQSTYHE